MGDGLRDGLDFSSKPFYHGSRPLLLPNPANPLMSLPLADPALKFWGNSRYLTFDDAPAEEASPKLVSLGAKP
jgi:hypothetical protein